MKPTFAAMPFTVTKGEQRSHQFFTDMLVFLAMSSVAMSQRFGIPISSEGPNWLYSSRAANMTIVMRAKGYLEAIGSGDFPDVIELASAAGLAPGFQDGLPPPVGADKAAGARGVEHRIIPACFALFVEQACEWMRRSGQTDVHKWPPVLNFCRVVRNAIVHGGTINITSDKAPVVSWEGLTYSHLNYGVAVLNADQLSIGDLLVLFLDLDNELTSIGAPQDLALP